MARELSEAQHLTRCAKSFERFSSAREQHYTDVHAAIAAGVGQADIARAVGVSRARINWIKNHREATK